MIHSISIAGSNFRSLSNIPHCWLKISLDLVSVPVWLYALLGQLKIEGLVNYYFYQLPNLTQIYLLTIIKYCLVFYNPHRIQDLYFIIHIGYKKIIRFNKNFYHIVYTMPFQDYFLYYYKLIKFYLRK